MQKTLSAYYHQQGIAASSFRCRHSCDCSHGAKDFVPAREAHVGDLYASGQFPRLLFISLDPATDLCGRLPQERTVAAVTRWESRQKRPVQGDALFRIQSHWYQTYALAHELLRSIAAVQGKEPPPFSEMYRYFVHTNSAKCKDAALGTKQGPARRFRNCSAFIPGEVMALEPDIMVTQGKFARESVEGAFSVLLRGKAPNRGYVAEVVQVGDRQTVKFATHHPNRRDNHYKQEVREAWYWYRRVAVVFALKGLGGLVSELGFRDA